MFKLPCVQTVNVPYVDSERLLVSESIDNLTIASQSKVMRWERLQHFRKASFHD